MLKLQPLLSQLTIKTKSLDLAPFDVNYVHPVEGDLGWAQREYIAEVERQYNNAQPVRLIVLKARQLGISTVTGGVFFWWSFLHPGANELIAAHESKNALELFGMTQLYWETFPYKPLFTLKYATKQHFHWIETHSKIQVASAKNVKFARGTTIHAAHLSEVAFYENPAGFMLALNQAVPRKHGTIVVLESTANGVGNYFYELWMEAEEGANDYVPLFFPWWKHSEYRLPTTLTIRSELSAEERELLRLSVSYEHIAWRRWAIKNLTNGDTAMFMQEYPATPEEAFITTGRPIFSYEHLKIVYKPMRGYRGVLIEDQRGVVKFNPDASGNLIVYKAPKPGRQDQYFVSGDPSETIVGDPSCIQVINRETGEQVAVWHGRINPLHFADEMVKVGKYYNMAVLCPEVEGGGQATVARILTLGYPFVWQHQSPDRIPTSFNTFGWSTNFSRKSWAIGTLQRSIIDHSITLHDRLTYLQLRLYVQLESGEWGPSDNSGHDDAVMSLAINITASRTLGPFTADAPQEHTIADISNQEYDAVL